MLAIATFHPRLASRSANSWTSISAPPTARSVITKTTSVSCVEMSATPPGPGSFGIAPAAYKSYRVLRRSARGCYRLPVTVDPIRQALGLVLFALVGSYILWIASRRASRMVRSLAMCSFAGHAALGIAIWYAVPAWIAGDAFGYDAEALGKQAATAGKGGFSFMLGGLYRLVGHAPAAGLLLNAMLMGLLVVVVATTANRLGQRGAASFAAIMALLLPPFIWWGSQLLREASVWVLIALAADIAVTIALSGFSWRRGALLLSVCLLMLTIRAPIAAVLAVSLALGLLFATAPRSGDHTRRVALVVAAIGLGLFLFPRFEALRSLEEDDSASIVQRRNDLATSNTGFGDMAVPTTGGLIGQLPSALPLVTFGPLPWQLPSSGMPGVADTLAWWFVVFWGVRGFRSLYRRFGRASWVLLIPAMLCS